MQKFIYHILHPLFLILPIWKDVKYWARWMGNSSIFIHPFSIFFESNDG